MFSKISFLIAALCLSLTSLSQVTDVDEKNPVTVNGIEYGYYIKNEQTKSVKDEEYGRFEITLYATNKTGCTKIYTEKATSIAAESSSLLASFNCTNANGKRLTAKSGTVKAREFYVNTKGQDNGKDVTRSVKAGYIFRNGESLSTNIIVLVPKGERPVIQCSVNNLPEL